MPTYQYACTSCREQLEVVQSFSDPALTECPQCGGALRKVFSAVGVVFKGSGFYKTDSRAKPADTAKSDSGTKPDAAPAAASTATSGTSGTSGTSSSSTSSTSSTPAAKTA